MPGRLEASYQCKQCGWRREKAGALRQCLGGSIAGETPWQRLPLPQGKSMTVDLDHCTIRQGSKLGPPKLLTSLTGLICLPSADKALAVQDRVHCRCAGCHCVHVIASSEKGAEQARLIAAAIKAGPVTGSECCDFVEKEKFSPASAATPSVASHRLAPDAVRVLQ